MSWVEKIRNKPHAAKIRLIWMWVAVAVIILVAIWAVTWRLRRDGPRDTTIINTIDQGIKDYKNNYNKPIK